MAISQKVTPKMLRGRAEPAGKGFMTRRTFTKMTAASAAFLAAALAVPKQIYEAQTQTPEKSLIFKNKITQAERKAAAAVVAQQKAAVGTLPAFHGGKKGTGGTAAAAMVAMPNLANDPNGFLIPDYFGNANWAFSPPLTKFIDKMAGLGPSGANALGQYIPVAVADNTTYGANCDYYEIALVEYDEQLHSEMPPTRHRGYVQLETSVVTGAHVALANPNGSAVLMPDGSQAYAVDNPHFLGPAIVATGGLPGQPGKPVRIKFYNLLPTGASGNLFIPVDKTVMGSGMGPLDMPMIPGMKEEYTQNRATIHLHGNNTVWISDGTAHQWITPAGEMTQYPQGVSVVDVPDMPPPGDGAMTLFYSNAQSARLMFYHDHAFGITRLNVYVGEAAAYVITDAVEQDLINGTNNSGVNPGLLHVLPDIGIPLVIQDRTFVDAATIGATDPTWLDPLQKTFGTNPGTAVHGDLWYPHIYEPAQNPWDAGGANAFGRWMYGPWFYPPTANLAHGPIPNPYCLPTPPPPNSYPNGAFDNSAAPWEPPYMPACPNPSMPGEGFMDTMMVNGTVFPYLEVEPKAYRFRVLNASNDRFVNLSLYKATGIVGTITLTGGGSGYTADPAVTITPGAGDITGHGARAIATVDLDPVSGTFGQVIAIAMTVVGSNYTANPVVTIAPPTAGVAATATAAFFTFLPGPAGPGFPSEVGMVPVSGVDWLPPFDVSGVPDQGNAGPEWWQIGTEGGFLPAPAVVPPGPITWNTNPTTFNFGTVSGQSLCLGTAERADVIVDFAAFTGQTLILYNDAPAAFPAPDPRVDYYTCVPDQTENGGSPTIPPGKGPNTRTIMQVRVGTVVTTPTTDVTLANLQTVWAKGPAAKRGVFEVSQDPIIVPQEAYNSAYGVTNFPTAPAEQYLQINQYTKTFKPIDPNGVLQAPLTLPVEPKAVHDEMGGVYDTEFGRMSGMLGLELPASQSRLEQFLAYGYSSPPVDLFKASIFGTLVGSLGDGTQIWNITQNGVDTHTIHVHLFNAQLINRVGWDGGMLPPPPNEIGWKETFRVNPLEQTMIALRPMLPTVAQVPFLAQVPNSIRLIDPTMPEGATLIEPPPAGWFDPNGVQLEGGIPNHKVNFGWEYVYHCHILAHEEMDMMHATGFAVPAAQPTGLTITPKGSSLVLSWTDGGINTTGFTLQRADDLAFTLGVVSWELGMVSTFIDNTAKKNRSYYYRLRANNVVGDTTLVGFPVITASSGFATAQYGTGGGGAPADPTLLTATAVLLGRNNRITLNWTDNSNNETSFTLQRATNAAFTQNLQTTNGIAANSTTFVQTVSRGTPTYYYRLRAINAAGNSNWAETSVGTV